MDFTAEERRALIDLLRTSLAYYHETLRDEHETVAAALAAYEATPEVTVLAKLDPKSEPLPPPKRYEPSTVVRKKRR